MSTRKSLVTAEDLLRPPYGGIRCELIEGEVIEMAPSGAAHGKIANRFNRLIGNHVDGQGLGVAFGAETGFLLGRDPDTVRAPDTALVAAARLPQGKLPRGFLDVVPDLVVEVASPSDTAPYHPSESRWLNAGAQLVWVAYPETESIMVYRQDRSVLLSRDEVLSGEQVLPGFSVKVSQVFA